jgi:hypothetical protein
MRWKGRLLLLLNLDVAAKFQNQTIAKKKKKKKRKEITKRRGGRRGGKSIILPFRVSPERDLSEARVSLTNFLNILC